MVSFMKVKFGSIIVNGRGTLGGHVYSQNHYGAFARTKVNPIDPSTVSQQVWRNFFSTIQTKWRNLSSVQQAAWQAASIDYPKTDAFGTVYYLTGYNLYISLNIPFFAANAALLTNPPVKAVPTSDCNGTMSMDFASNAYFITFVNPPNEANVEIQWFVTRPLSNGITYVSTELRLIGSFTAVGSSPVDFTSEWRTKFGADPLSTQKIFTKLVPVNFNTGDYGIPFTYSSVQP